MAKKKSQLSTELVTTNIQRLPMEGAKLRGVTEISVERLQAQVRPYLEGVATLQLAAEEIQVLDEDSLQRSINLRNDAGTRIKGLEGVWGQYKDPLNEARKVILDLEHATIDPLEEVKKDLTAKAEDYLNKQRRAKAEMERKLNEQAEKMRRSSSNEAEELIARGYVREGLAKRQEAALAGSVILPDSRPEVQGAAIGTRFKGKVTDIVALCRSIASGETLLMHEVKGEMRPLVTVDQVVLNAIVSRQQDQVQIPGVVVDEGASLSSRGTR